MESRTYRVEFGLLVLLVCAIMAWFGEDRTPSREVVELVSVVYKPARMVPSEPVAMDIMAAGEWATPQAVAAAAPMDVAAPKQLAHGRAPVVAPRARAGPRPEPAPVRAAKASIAAPGVVKAACRPPTCGARARATNAVAKRTGLHDAGPVEPPLPRVFVPIRKLGLYLQARLDAPRPAKAAPRQPRKR